MEQVIRLYEFGLYYDVFFFLACFFQFQFENSGRFDINADRHFLRAITEQFLYRNIHLPSVCFDKQLPFGGI